MKAILTAVLALSLVACVAPHPATHTADSRPFAAKPELSVLHVSGRISYVPPNSKWPASIKEGARFDYWAVLDNRVRDEDPSRHHGIFMQKAWPSRYDLRVGDFRFSSDQHPEPAFSVGTFDGELNNSDGYGISPMYHHSFPELPGLEAVAFHVSLRTEKPAQITTDRLPVRPIPIADLGGGYHPTFRGYGLDATDHSAHPFHGDIDKFEVFQARLDRR